MAAYNPPAQNAGTDTETARQQPYTCKSPVVAPQIFEPGARVDVMSNKARGHFISRLDLSMAFVVIPFAGLKPLAHGIDIEAGVPDCPSPCPAVLQFPSFLCVVFECITDGVRACTRQDS